MIIFHQREIRDQYWNHEANMLYMMTKYQGLFMNSQMNELCLKNIHVFMNVNECK